MKALDQKLARWFFLFSFLIVQGCKDDGDDGVSTKIELGKEYGGGIVFYIDHTGEHGLIAAKSDLNSIYPWWNGVYLDILNADGSDLETGQSNTNAILSAQGTGNYAASMCDSYEVDGFDDWYLPSKGELNLLYNELHLNGLGNFTETLYWSSTRFNEATAWYQDFGDCCPGFNDRKVPYRIRPVRAF